MNRLFVYGTLMRGERNYRLLRAAHARFLGEAETRVGWRLIHLGAYPAMVDAAARYPIAGEVFAIDDDGLAACDRFEGAPTLYRRAHIELRDDAPAFAYVFANPPAQGAIIRSGSWRVAR